MRLTSIIGLRSLLVFVVVQISSFLYFCTVSFSIVGNQMNSEKLQKSTFKLNVQKFSFNQRVINQLKSLIQQAVDCTTVNTIKWCLDCYIRQQRYL